MNQVQTGFVDLLFLCCVLTKRASHFWSWIRRKSENTAGSIKINPNAWIRRSLSSSYTTSSKAVPNILWLLRILIISLHKICYFQIFRDFQCEFNIQDSKPSLKMTFSILDNITHVENKYHQVGDSNTFPIFRIRYMFLGL